MIKSYNKWAFTLIELLIVITIIWVLTALAANFLWEQAWAKSRDTIRISDINQIWTVVSSLQNRFHTPPLIDNNLWARYPASCNKEGSLYECFKVLRITSQQWLDEMFTDPKQWVSIWDKTFQYYYWASPNWFKVCAHMEDQWAFEKINANGEGQITNWLVPWESTAYMYCLVNGSDVSDILVNSISQLANE